ncbi:MAG TPA: WD40 repeat domain-containing protein, partial [Pseudoxanthomonas sp.]|nr:WD40 repeat domain-containing protein [Pseudoxanthomonas sp.]
MMRFADLLLCCCATLLVAGCSGQDEAAPATPAPTPTATVAPPKPAPEPKIVVQLGHQAPVLAVRWLNGVRQLASLAQDGSIVIWNLADGTVLDHAQVPLDPAWLLSQGEVPAALGFRAMTEGSASGSLTIAYAGRDASIAERTCPQAHHADTPWCTFSLDVTTRVVRADASLPIPTTNANSSAQRWPLSPDGKLRPEPNHGNGRRGLPDLSDEHFGDIDPTCSSAKRCRYGVTLLATDDSAAPRALTVDPRGYFLDADLSPDGLHLLRVVSPFPNEGTRVDALDLSNGSRERPLQLARAYHQVQWLDSTHYLLTSEGYSGSDDTEEAAAGFPPTLLGDAACAKRGDCATLESHWQVRQAEAGALVALGSLVDNCYRIPAGGVGCAYDELRPDDGNETQDPPATGLVYRAAGSRTWMPLALDALGDEVITAIETSPDHRQLAVATRSRDRADTPDATQVLRVWLMDLDKGSIRAPRRLLEIVDPLAGADLFTDASSIRALSFSADARRMVLTQTKTAGANKARADLYLLDTDAAATVRTIPDFSRRAMALGDNRVLGLDDGALLDLDSGK